MASTLNGILEKLNNHDKDFRYMAASDLLQELQKDSFKMDHDVEVRLVPQVLKLLSEKGGDLQGLAVKCLPMLVRKMEPAQVDDMVERLFQMVRTGKEEERDISSIGLKTVLAEVPPSGAGTAVRSLTPRLLDALSSSNDAKPEDTSVTIACLEITHDVLQNFPSLVTPELPKIRNQLLPALASTRPAVRKRAVACVGSMCASLADALYVDTVNHLITEVEAAAEKGIVDAGVTTHIQAVCAIARASGFRLGTHLGRIVPLIIAWAEHAQASGERGVEMAEHCLQAAEALVMRCPAEATPFVPQLLDLGLRYVKYDPNYADDEDDEDEEAEAMDEDDEEEDFGDDYSDDDDTSWKVRRAAAKLLAALISAKPDSVPAMFGQLLPALLARFREREESVKTDVFGTARLLVQCAAGPVAGAALEPLLRAEVPAFVAALRKQLHQRSPKTRSGVFVLLRELAVTLPGGLGDHTAALLPAVERALHDKQSASALKMDVLSFLRLVLDSHPPAVLHPHLKLITAPVVALVMDRYYKIAAEALRVCGSIAKVLRPEPPQPSPVGLADSVPAIYAAVSERLAALDQDQEVKEASIMTMGTLVAYVGDALGGDLAMTLDVLTDRLKNEITRLTAVRAFEAIVSSPLALPLEGMVQPLLAELASYLRKNNRTLRQGSLQTLVAMVDSHAGLLTETQLAEVVAAVAPILSDKDLLLTATALQLLLSLVQAHPQSAGPLVGEHVMAPVLALLASPLLQGAAITRAQAFLRGVAVLGTGGLSFKLVLDQLLGVAKDAEPGAAGYKQTVTNVALCVAALTEGASWPERSATVQQFMGGIAEAESPSTRLLSLYCLGYIGRQADLSAQQEALLPALTATFESPSEEVRVAGAFALGLIASGSVPTYLPLLVERISDPARSGEHYLLLQALKELILAAPAEQLKPHVARTLPLLFAQVEGAQEEGVRTVVSECLGKLLAAAPEDVLPALQSRLGHEEKAMRAIAVSSLRFAIVDAPSPLDDQLPTVVGSFLALVADEELAVRHAATLTLSCVAHNQPAYLADCLTSLLDPLYQQTEKNAALVHQVEMGPFRHTVDDGLELRKAAFECMDTLLSACADRLDPRPFIARLVAGLTDDYDIKMLCHLILCKMAAQPGTSTALLGMLEQLCDPLKKMVTGKLKDNAVKQEVERHEEMVRAGMRVSYLLSKISGAESCVKFDEFVRSTLKSGDHAMRYQRIIAEVDGADDGNDAVGVS